MMNREFNPGDLVRVTFGQHGTQKAQITHGLKTDVRGGKYYKGKKYIAASDRWTKNPVKIYACEILGLIAKG